MPGHLVESGAQEEGDGARIGELRTQPFATGVDKLARKPLVIDEVTGELMKRGVFCMGWLSHLILAPPLIIDDAQIDEAVAALDGALALADRHLG